MMGMQQRMAVPSVLPELRAMLVDDAGLLTPLRIAALQDQISAAIRTQPSAEAFALFAVIRQLRHVLLSPPADRNAFRNRLVGGLFVLDAVLEQSDSLIRPDGKDLGV